MEPAERFINVVIPPLAQSLLYKAPPQSDHAVGVGSRVSVPLGSRTVLGYVTGFSTEEQADALPKQLKQALSDEYPCQAFLPDQVAFFQRVAEYYGDTLSNVIDTAVPTAVAPRVKKLVTLNPETQHALRGKLERAVVETLAANSSAADYSFLVKQHKGAGPALRRLAARGVVTIACQEMLPMLTGGMIPGWAKRTLDLNEAQRSALDAILKPLQERRYAALLLHGVTGSGKTEVYIEAIQAARKLGLGALVIVPEIALTPQLIDRFRARLGEEMAVLHSALQRRNRWEAWRSLVEGRTNLALGVRSGVFAPVHNLGLIIVDEEHDTSFKQQEGLRYNARDLAVMRAHLLGCPVVLGSATPSLESLSNVTRKKYHYLSLPSRPRDMGKVQVELVDVSTIKPWEMASKNVSPLLLEGLSDALARGEQAFILYNRRGFASYLQCERCETALECPNCSVALTYHRSSHALLCHYCNLSLTPPEFCAKCGVQTDAGSSLAPARLSHRGAGTEKIHEELKRLFPSVTIDRLDRDAVSDVESYRQILDRVRTQETRILVGTQMIAKGHDLPGVTLVGVVDCDVGLHFPDFRAQERVFQLLTQAAGRAGRGQYTGRVILQTRTPQNLSLQSALRGDYLGFARQELKNRELLGYPPYRRMLRVLGSSAIKELPAKVLEGLRERIEEYNQQIGGKFSVLGPSPAPLERLKTEWRWHLLVKSRKPAELISLVRTLRGLKIRSTKVKVVFDVDPQDML